MRSRKTEGVGAGLHERTLWKESPCPHPHLWTSKNMARGSQDQNVYLHKDKSINKEMVKSNWDHQIIIFLNACCVPSSVLGSCTHSWHLEGDSTVYMRQMSHGIVSWMSCCSVTKLCWTLFDPMNCSTLGLRVLHYLPEFAQTYVHWVGDAIQPSHPLSPLLLLPSIFPSIRVIYNESVLHIKWPKYWSFSISPYNEYARLISFKIDWFDLLAFEYRSKG